MAVKYLRSGVPGVPCDFRGPVAVTVMHTNGVDLLFVTLDAVRSSNVVTEDPSLSCLAATSQAVQGSSSEQGRTQGCQVSVDTVRLQELVLLLVQRRFHLIFNNYINFPMTHNIPYFKSVK